ncbi:peroxiredoxin, Ohr subfamily [Pseudonocardia thermophila]|jgi:peroxiredoxin, Ohr subfamily|uniref:Peroxiredoxin, Ohr subfamily n=1 Tax=Pseudonocardia thermophila TaxID=1848 RepID=A0A1M6WXU2_PSETH|nr:Ohr family peroxiredoxin [Pseudonocardia thermophila]SHK98537.1 peroxiredoxin, Ohr subfamily [Pseudonocardia thermophila]
MSTTAEPKVLYTAVVEVTGGRAAGHATSQTGSLEVDLARPAERGTEAKTDPEELFAAGYAACFDASLAAAARRARVKLGPSTVTAAVSLLQHTETRFGISVKLTVRAPECPQDTLAELVEAAHQACPYSNALRSGAPVEIESHGAA